MTDISLSFTVGGVTFDVTDFDQLAEIETNAPDIFKSVAAINQAGIAHSVLTAKTSKNTPDVAVNESTGPGGVPSCKHGVMTDLRGQTYKTGDKKGQSYPHSFYCSAGKDTPFKEKCEARD